MSMGALRSVIKIFCCLVTASQQHFLMMQSWYGYKNGNGTITVGETAQPRLCLLTWMLSHQSFAKGPLLVVEGGSIAMTINIFFSFLHICTDDGKSPERD